MRKLIALAGVGLSWSVSVPAQTPAYQILDQIVVTGTKTERRVADAPVKTEVVNSERMESLHMNDASEAVSQMPAVSLQGLRGRAGQSAVIQGLGEGHVLVLVDGVPLMQESATGFDLSQLGIEDIERIEVVKGGASALYGSHAMGGVIHILTKRPGQKFKWSADVRRGFYPSSVRLPGQPPPTDIKLSAAGRTGSGEDSGLGYRIALASRNEGAVDMDKSTITEDGSHVQKYNGSLLLQKKFESGLNLEGEYSGYTEDVTSVSAKSVPLVGFARRENTSRVVNQKVRLGADKHLTKTGKLTGFASYEQTRDWLSLDDDPETDYGENRKQARLEGWRGEVQWDELYFENHQITGGLVYLQQFLNQTGETKMGPGAPVETLEVDRKRESSVEAYLQDDMIYDRYEITPGVRAQHNGGFGAQLTPKIGVRYTPVSNESYEWNLRASVAGGYRVPSLKERFYVLDHRSIANYIVTGNADLKPEKALSYQLGAEWIRKDRASVHVNFFRNDISDLIETAEIEDGTSAQFFQYQNFARARTQGVELGAGYRLGSALSVEHDYTYTDPKNLTNSQVLPFRPFHLARTMLTYTVLDKKLALSLIGKYRGSEYTDEANTLKSPEFITLDTKVNYTFSERLKFYAGVDNLTGVKRKAAEDSTTSAIDRRPVIERYAYLGLKISGF